MNKVSEKYNKFLFMKKITSFIGKVFYFTIGNSVKKIIASFSIKYVYGPKRVNYRKNEAVVICLVKNGELYIKSFMEHYFSMGVKHVFLLDNNSEDDTIAIASNYKNVSIFKSNLKFASYEIELRQVLIYKFCRNRWCIVVDIDELFDFPFSNSIKLSSLLDYLNLNLFTAVVTQMLDMFSDKKLNDLKSTNEDSLKELYEYYDISSIEKKEYRNLRFPGINITKNIISNNQIKFYGRGIRKTIFGLDNFLTKHALVFIDNKILPYSGSHFVSFARLADFSAVLYHYKFIGNFFEAAIIDAKTRPLGCRYEYVVYSKRFQENPSICLKQETSKRINNVNELVENGFLVVSDNYMRWVRQCQGKK